MPDNIREEFLWRTQHDGVDDESHDVLQNEDHDGSQTLLGYHPSSEADGHLDFDGEEESWSKRPEVKKKEETCSVIFHLKLEVRNILDRKDVFWVDTDTT